jgi:hypothetical protein
MIAKSISRRASNLPKANRSSVEPPTPMELRRRCEDIRRGWTESERSKRSVQKLCPWLAPVIKVSELATTSD